MNIKYKNVKNELCEQCQIVIYLQHMRQISDFTLTCFYCLTFADADNESWDFAFAKLHYKHYGTVW